MFNIFHLHLNCAGASQWGPPVSTPPKQQKENLPPPDGPPEGPVTSKTTEASTVLVPIKPIATEAHQAAFCSESSTCYVCEKNSSEESILLCDGRSKDGGECNREAHFW